MSGTRPDTYPTHTAESLVAPAFHCRVICRVARSPALASQGHEPGAASPSLPCRPLAILALDVRREAVRPKGSGPMVLAVDAAGTAAGSAQRGWSGLRPG